MSLLLLFNDAGAPGGNNQALAVTLDDVAVAVSQSVASAGPKSQSLAVTLDDVTVAIAQTGPDPLIAQIIGGWRRERRQKERDEEEQAAEEAKKEAAALLASLEIEAAPAPKAPKPRRLTLRAKPDESEQIIRRGAERARARQRQDEEDLMLMY